MHIKNLSAINFRNCLLLIFMELVIGGSFFLYRSGPWIYPKQKSTKLLIYVIGLMLFFAIGYLLQLVSKKRRTRYRTDSINNSARILMVINVFLLVPYCYGKTGNVFPHFITALSNLSVAYTTSARAVSTGGIIHILAAVANVVIYPLLLITFFYYERISVNKRRVMLVEVIWYYLTEISTGHNRGIFFFTILMFICCILFVCSNENKNNIYKRRKVILATAFVVLAGVYFSMSMGARNNNTKSEIEMTGKDASTIIKESDSYSKMIVGEYGYRPSVTWVSEEDIQKYNDNKDKVLKINPYYATDFTYSYVDTNHWIYRLMPSRLRFYMMTFIYYISHGYYAVNVGLDIPFETAFGLGTFSYFQGIAERIFGVDFYKLTYVYKINQSGYPVSLYWGTAYTQWASDISWLGVIVLMGIIGYVISKLWIAVVYEEDLFSMVFLCPLMFYLVMILSWWHPGMSGGDFVLFHVLFLSWIVHELRSSRKDYRW